MKAWFVKEKDAFCATVVFAETRGKAKYLALSTDTCEDASFCDIEVRRMKELDKYYKEGKWELDWENPADRIALVKDGGFVCDPDYYDWEDCAVCPAKEYCDYHKDRMAEMECLFCVNSMSADAPDGTEVLVCFNCKGHEGKEMYVDAACDNYKEN